MPVYDGHNGPGVRNDRGETKIGQTRMTGVVNKNARLRHERISVFWEYSWKFTNPFEIAVNYTVRVKVVETVSDIRHLARVVSASSGVVP